MQNKLVITHFIKQVWNQGNFDQLDNFLHPHYKDHSLPKSLTADKEGLRRWILAISSAFEHTTIIEEQVSEGDKTVIKIKMLIKHIGKWRDIPPTGLEVSTGGYRFYKLSEGKIMEAWALVDGEGLENALKHASQGCKIPQ